MQLRESASAAPVPSFMAGQAIDEVLLRRFCDALTGFDPFEKKATVAVAFSGGSDSYALLNLATQWATNENHKLVALTVDHGLRPDSHLEAEKVGDWAQALGVPHHVLRWQGGKPAAGIMSAARDARYRLIDQWCGDNNVLHVLVGHTMDDQLETHLMRKDHASGYRGLAGMSQVLELSNVRVMRPLLAVSRTMLRRYLTHLRLDWIDDPSNENDTFERVRVRKSMQVAEKERGGLAGDVKDLGQKRSIQSARCSALIARAVDLNSLGAGTVKLVELADAPPELKASVLSRVLGSLGGKSYQPSLGKTQNLLDQLKIEHQSGTKMAATLSGCRVFLWRDQLQILREARNLPHSFVVASHQRVYWDNRFEIEFGAGLAAAIGETRLRPFRRDDWGIIKSVASAAGLGRRAMHCCEGLPVIEDDLGLFALPHLGYFRKDSDSFRKNAGDIVSFLSFCPLNSLSGTGFSVA